jgi:adenylosuccinate lyase
LAVTENIALWHERDISHSSVERVALPDACIVLDYIMDLFTQVVQGMRVYPERMKANLDITCGLIFSQRVLLALMEKGLPRPMAYEVVQRNAMRAWEQGLSFRQLLGQDPQVSSLLSPQELDALFDLQYYLRYVDQVFRRVGL